MKNTYDFVVIGGDFLGLLTALSLQKKGYSTCLIEESSQIGRGLRSPENTFEFRTWYASFLCYSSNKNVFSTFKKSLGGRGFV